MYFLNLLAGVFLAILILGAVLGLIKQVTDEVVAVPPRPFTPVSGIVAPASPR